jgi:hypothetical protein
LFALDLLFALISLGKKKIEAMLPAVAGKKSSASSKFSHHYYG